MHAYADAGYEPVRLRPQSLRHTVQHQQQQQQQQQAAVAEQPARLQSHTQRFTAANPRPDSLLVQHSLQETYKLDQLPCSVHGPASELRAATSSTPGTKTAIAQQHAPTRHRQQQQQRRIAAVKASAAAVQEWTSAQLERSAPTAAAAPADYRTQAERVHVTSRELGQLPPPVLQLLSTEAQQGLLHLQALRLLTPQLEVTYALIGAPGTPVQMCAAALHRLQVVAQHNSSPPHRTRHSNAVERGSARTRNGDSNLQLQTAASREALAGCCQALGEEAVSGGDVVDLQLLICRGQLLQDNDATVAVLQRAVEQGTWVGAGALLGQLKALCRAHSVPCAAVDGGMLLRLAAAACCGPLPALADLLACISNLGDVAPYLL